MKEEGCERVGKGRKFSTQKERAMKKQIDELEQKLSLLENTGMIGSSPAQFMEKISELESKLARAMGALSLGVDMCLLEIQNEPADHDLHSWFENVAKKTLEEIGEQE